MTDSPSDHDRDAFTAELTARLTSPSTHASLSPAVRSVVTETFDPASPSRSPSLAVPIALVRATAAIGGDSESSTQSNVQSSPTPTSPHSPSRATLLEVSTSLAFLGGYAKLRRNVLEATTTTRDRDVTILASDYLHASAHATLAGVPIPTDRHVNLYRALTAGSSALAARFLERAGTLESAPNPNEQQQRGAPKQPTPTAVLAGTGSALGAAVAGSSRDTLDAMRTYGESLITAIDAVSGPTGDRSGSEAEHSDALILETVERVLLGDRRGAGATAPSDGHPSDHTSGPGSDVPDPATVGGAEAEADTDIDTTTDTATHLERARSALDGLPETAHRERLEAATLVPVIVELDR